MSFQVQGVLLGGSMMVGMTAMRDYSKTGYGNGSMIIMEVGAFIISL